MAKKKPQNIDKQEEFFRTLRPMNNNYIEEYNHAKGHKLLDIGVLRGTIWATFDNGSLLVSFRHSGMHIEPHEAGRIIDSHQFNGEPLTDITSFIPAKNHLGHIDACIFCFCCENRCFEYVITPGSAPSLEFNLTFIPHGENYHA